MSTYFLLIVLFILLSAFFSGSETAFFSLSKIQVKKLELQDSSQSGRILKLLKRPRKLLITILLGNTIVNVAASSFSALLVQLYSTEVLGMDSIPWWLLGISVVIMTSILIVFGEITPKLFALSSSEVFSRFSSGILEIISYLLYPLIYVLILISKIFSRKTDGQHLLRTSFTSEDLKNIVDSTPKNLPLDDNEKKIISGIFRFTSTDAKKIMVPRVDIKSVSINEGFDEIKEEIINSGHSRLPVYKKSIDDIIGIIYAKDIILNQNVKSIKEILRKPIYVTENTKIQTLLNLFLAKKTHLAIVIDEYGGTSGLITLEDILEELVGEIVDEYDKEQPHLSSLNNKEYLASGMLNITELNDELDLGIDDVRYDNLAAFLYDIFNRVPAVGERITFDDRVEFIVKSIQGQRIEEVKIIILDSPQEP